MLPAGLDIKNLEVVKQPSLQHKMNLNDSFIAGKCDGKEGLKQAVYKILSTERYENVIYSRNYGVELKDLFGQPVKTVIALIESRIKEALLQDDRITDVDSFIFDTSQKHKVSVTFTVHSELGDFEVLKEVIV